MIVIADTGPVNYPILIGEIEILPALYGRILIPSSVWEELKEPRARRRCARGIARPPAWLETRTPVQAPDAALAAASLDAGTA